MQRVGTYKRNSNNKSYLYHHVLASDHEIFKGTFFARVIYSFSFNWFVNNGIESANVIVAHLPKRGSIPLKYSHHCHPRLSGHTVQSHPQTQKLESPCAA